MAGAPTKPSKTHKVFSKRTGKYYRSVASRAVALKASRTCKGRKTVFNRKRRSMVNGRMYVNKERMDIAHSEIIRQKSPENLAQLKQMSINNTGNKVTAAKISKACKKNSAKISKWMKEHMNQEHVKDFYREAIDYIPEMRGWATDNQEELVQNLTTHRKGKQVIQFVDCEREKSVGVVRGV